MHVLQIIMLAPLLLTTASASEEAQIAPDRLRIDHVVSSSVSGEDYRLFVSLPEAYSESSGDKYPVVYVLDIDSEYAQQLSNFHKVMAGLPNVPSFVLVGIGFSPDEEHIGLRTAHFSPTNIVAEDMRSFAGTISTIRERRNETPVTVEMLNKWRSGRASEFSIVLRDELVPFIGQTYRISGNNTVMGASLAGLFLTLELFTNPDSFDNYVITSPSLWWQNFELLGDAEDRLIGRRDIDTRVYLSVGSLENSDMLESYELLRSSFEERGHENLEFSAEIIENEDHISVIPVSYMNGLQYIFSATPN